MRSKAYAVTVVMLLLANIAAIAVPAKALLPEVWIPTDYPTIQEGINAVDGGGTVHVGAGTYFEHLTISKPLTLEGENRATTIIDGSGSGNVIEVSSTYGVTVSGFTVQNGGGNGVFLWDADNCQLEDLDVKSNGGHGIFTQYSEYVVIMNVETHANVGQGIALGLYPSYNIIEGVNAYSNSHGITVYDWPTDVTIKDCNVYLNTYQGIILGWTTDGVIRNCNAWSNGQEGIKLEASSNSRVEDCISTSNAHGIGISVFGYNVITRCQASNNLGNGFYLSSAYGCTIEKCLSSSNTVGISFWGGFWGIWTQNNVVTENIISGNGLGIDVFDKYCTDNLIYHNDFIGNTQQASDAASNAWDNGYPSGGNFWSDYMGVDVYSGVNQDEPGSDGIGDTPYDVDADTMDRYPLMERWNPTPPTPSVPEPPIIILITAVTVGISLLKRKRRL
ncbi:MAG: right-handed parallel beta-helix repeat-containing protein [Candidatus Bathyarchaeia archaeon]